MTAAEKQSTEKALLRKQMLQKRSAVPLAERQSAATSITLHFADHPYLTYAKSFAGYSSIKDELEVLPIFQHMQQFKKLMGLPRIQKDTSELLFKQWEPGTMLEKDSYGIRVPKDDAESFIPEVVLVPLLAFDMQGYRLGYGGGYYDRTIQSLRTEAQPPLFVGVAYAMQEVPSLPIEAHDQPLDGILTPEGVSFFRAI